MDMGLGGVWNAGGGMGPDCDNGRPFIEGERLGDREGMPWWTCWGEGTPPGNGDAVIGGQGW